MIRRTPELGYRWFVHDGDSGAVLGWFDYQAHWFADEQRQAGREVEIGYSWRSLCQPRRPRQPDRQPRSEPEAGA
jgi:hypothetical protein